MKRKIKNKSFFKQLAVATLILWLSLAFGSIDLDQSQINILHKYPFVRCLVVYIFALAVLEVEENSFHHKILLSFIIVMIYIFLAEINIFVNTN